MWSAGVGVSEQLAIALGDFLHCFGSGFERSGDGWGTASRQSDLRRLFGKLVIWQLCVNVPQRPNRVGRLRARGLGEVILPATHGSGDELALLEILVAVLAACSGRSAGDYGVHLVCGEQVVGGAFAEHGDLLVELLDAVFLHLVLALLLLGKIGGVRRTIRLDAQQWFFRRLLAGGEDAVETVILRRRDGVVFVVVAARTLRGQAHRAARHHVDAVVNDVVDVV